MCASALIFLHGANDLGLNSTVGLSFVFSLGSHDFIALNWYPPTLKGGLFACLLFGDQPEFPLNSKEENVGCISAHLQTAEGDRVPLAPSCSPSGFRASPWR